MSSQSNITLADGASPTPANHTFVAQGVDGSGVARWVEKSAGIVSGFLKLTTSIKLPTKPGDPVRHQMKLICPTIVTETINGVSYQKVARQILADVSFVIPQDATEQERRDALTYFSGMFGSSSGNQLGFQIIAQEGVY